MRDNLRFKAIIHLKKTRISGGGVCRTIAAAISIHNNSRRQARKPPLLRSSLVSSMVTDSTVPTDGLIDGKQILGALRALGRGDFAVRLPMDQTGMAGAVAEAFNDIAQQMAESTDELDRIGLTVVKEGKIDQRLPLGNATGGWADRVHFVNSLIGNLVEPTVEVARVIGAVAQGDLSQKMVPAIDGRPLRGAFLRISDTVNTMVDQLSSFASEVTRVAARSAPKGSWADRPRSAGRRHVERPHRQCQFHGQQPHRPGAEHRRGHHRRRQRRPLAEDHCRRRRARFWS